MADERRSSGQMIVAIATIVSVIVGSVSLIAFIQTAERRITTMEVRIETLRDSIEYMRLKLNSQIRK
jgi:preprotein translocase subunit SecY